MSGSLAGSRGFRLGFRALAATLVAVAAWDPPLPLAGEPDLVVLIDDSASVSAGETDLAWSEVARALRDLPEDSRVDVLRFAAVPVEEMRGVPPGVLDPGTLPRTRPLDPVDTNVEAALRAGLSRVRADGKAVLVLLTDGRETLGQAAPVLETARAAGVDVLARDTRGSGPPGVIAGVSAPAYATAAAPFQVLVTTLIERPGEYRLGIEMDGAEAGMRTLDAEAGDLIETAFTLSVPTARAATLSVRLLDGAGETVDQSTPAAMINVRGPVPVLYVSDGGGALFRSLASGGWPVEAVSPGGLDGMADRLGAYPVIVLDDVDASAVRDLTWGNLVAAVRQGGSGLIVLGGRRSFGSGGYRGSVLESLLPVTAEPPDPRGVVSVMFVVDTSGSMGRTGPGTGRLSLARRSVLAAAASLLPRDEVGLVGFDVKASLRLPLDGYRDPVAALDDAWPVSASGGTDPAGALALAAEQLSATASPDRLLVLISDGYLPSGDVADLGAHLEEAGVELLAWSVGADADPAALEALTRHVGGRFFQVSDPETLPRLVRTEIEGRRPSREEGRTRLIVPGPLPEPLADVSDWPDVLGYSLVAARPAADVYLAAANGDPILVGGWANAGEVLVLACGIGAWTTDWFDWQGFPEFAGALVAAVNPHRPPSGLVISVTDRPGRLAIRLEEFGSAGAPGGTVAPLDIFVGRPAGGPVLARAEPVLPAVYEAVVPASGPGRYDVLVRRGGQSARYAHARTTFAERSQGARSALDDWTAAGLVRPWRSGALSGLGTASVRGMLRSWLAVAGLVVFLAGLAAERGLGAWLETRQREFRRRHADADGAGPDHQKR